MQYGAGLLSGIAGSALFWLVEKMFLALPDNLAIAGAVACFVLCGGAGYWLASRSKPAQAPGVRIASNLKGRNVKAHVDGVRVQAGTPADIASDISADRDIDTSVKNVSS